MAACVDAGFEMTDVIPPGSRIDRPPPTHRRARPFAGLAGGVTTTCFDGRAKAPGVVIHGRAIINRGDATCPVEPGRRMQAAANGAVWFLHETDKTQGEEPVLHFLSQATKAPVRAPMVPAVAPMLSARKIRA